MIRIYVACRVFFATSFELDTLVHRFLFIQVDNKIACHLVGILGFCFANR